MNSGDGWCPQRLLYLGGEISVGSRGEFPLASSSVCVQNRVCSCKHPFSSNVLSSEGLVAGELLEIEDVFVDEQK